MRKYSGMLLPFCLAAGLWSGLNAAAATDLKITATSSGGDAMADLVVYLTSDGDTPQAADTPVMIGQQDIQFSPRLSVVSMGARIRFVNHDSVAHHVFSFSDQAPENLELVVEPDSQSEDYVFAKQGFSKIGCNIHDNMSAFIFAAPSTHTAISAADGSVVLTGVAAGDYTLWVWSSEQPDAPLLKRPLSVGNTSSPIKVSVPAAQKRKPQRNSFDDY